MLVEIHQSDDMGNVYTLKEPLYYRDLVVPVGFESDGASVPRVFWRLVFPPGDTQALRAAFLHDYLYRTHPEGWTRKQADDLFYDVLVADGVPKWRARLAWLGVRIGGGSAWNATVQGMDTGARAVLWMQGDATGKAAEGAYRRVCDRVTPPRVASDVPQDKQGGKNE